MNMTHLAVQNMSVRREVRDSGAKIAGLPTPDLVQRALGIRNFLGARYPHCKNSSLTLHLNKLNTYILDFVIHNPRDIQTPKPLI
jgi:hypothetical protein